MKSKQRGCGIVNAGGKYVFPPPGLSQSHKSPSQHPVLLSKAGKVSDFPDEEEYSARNLGGRKYSVHNLGVRRKYSACNLGLRKYSVHNLGGQRKYSARNLGGQKHSAHNLGGQRKYFAHYLGGRKIVDVSRFYIRSGFLR